jgi:hypothetical protein
MRGRKSFRPQNSIKEVDLRVKKLLCAVLCVCLCFSLFLCNPNTLLVTAVDVSSGSATKTVSFSGAAQNQTQTIDLPSGAKVMSASVDNGNVSYSQNGTQVTVNVFGGQSENIVHKTLISRNKCWKVWVDSGPHYDSWWKSFYEETYNYNDGQFSGLLTYSCCGSELVLVSPESSEYVRKYYGEWDGTVSGYECTTAINYSYNVTISYVIDTTPPTGSYTLSKSAWTCGNVTITVTAADSGSGVASITTPSGTVVTASSTTYTVSANGTYTFTLKDNDGNSCAYYVTVANIDRTVSVTHPLSVSYTLDPNTDTFTAEDITITNNSQHIGVAVAVQSLKSNGISDISPNSYFNWDALTASQTSSGMALGISVKSGGWATINATSPVYATDIVSSAQFGILNIAGTGKLTLCAKYGLAWAEKTTVTQHMTLVFTARDVS